MAFQSGKNELIFYVGLAFFVVCLLWMVVPPVLSKVCQGFTEHPPTPEPHDAHTHQNSNIFGSGQVTEVDDFNIQEEAQDEVEVFLAEVRRTSAASPSVSLSTQARNEYISNLLISKRVVMQHKGEAPDEPSSDEPTTGILVLAEEGRVESETSPGSNQIAEMQCPICLVEYEQGDEIYQSHNKKCNHHFHSHCIKNWLLQQRDDCPCCRNNYLALSDDEEGDEREERRSRPPLTDDPWVPSYLAPFNRGTEGERSEQLQRLEQSYHAGVIQSGRGEPDPEIGHLGLVSEVSFDGDVIFVERGHWTDEEESIVQTESQNDPDEWSCPSVEDSIDETDNQYTIERCRIRRLRRQTPSSCLYEDRSAVEQTESLQLGDLVVEGLMRRLEERGDETNSHTASSNSVYTEGSDVGDHGSPIIPNRGDLDMCAICRCEYRVNQELCWSQDPLCSHVFHRQCMQTWILDHDYCPLCKPHSDDIMTASISTASPIANPPDVDDTESNSSELFLETEMRVVSSLELDPD